MANAIRIDPSTKQPLGRVRVAAYCRVSSNSADQLNSYANQLSYYTKLSKVRTDWNFIGIFADEGISGTKAENRPEFQRLLRYCKAHQVDLKKLQEILSELEAPLESFDEKLFFKIVEDMTINKNDEMTITILGGLRFTERI